MPNITISLDEELLKSGRRYAQEHQTSMNAPIRQLLEQTVRFQTDDWLEECFRKEAIDCSIINKLSFSDALIVCAAESAKCEKLWSEDLNDGQLIRGVRVENPF